MAGLGYVAGALQPVLVLFSTCGSQGEDCPPGNPILIADDASIAGVIETIQGVLRRGRGRR